VEALVADIADVGLPCMRSHASYDGVVDALATGCGRVGGPAIERLPLAHALASDRTAAHHALESMKRAVDVESTLTFRYLRFIDGFQEEFPATGQYC
jgi:hypothetical protein